MPNYAEKKGKKMTKLYYGLTEENQIQTLAKKVCDCLGYGSNQTALELILETAAQETRFGTYEDPTKNAGNGLCQFDKLPFEDTKIRTSKANKIKIYQTFGINIDYVEWDSLRYNPLLSLIFCRLKYLLVRSAIPADVEGRAKYWKKWYNSYLGKGTEQEYIENSSLVYA